jgi:hypothetical protein
MNFFSPSETSDMLDCIIADCEAPFVVCGSCCDWDCCGALGWSCAASGKASASNNPINTAVANRVAIGKQIAGRTAVGQARRLLVAAALRTAFGRNREERANTRAAQRSGYSLTDRSRSAFAITETELKLIAAPAIIGLRRIPNSG